MPVTASQIFACLEEFFSGKIAEDWDNVGLQVGDPTKEVGRVLVALDPDPETVKIGIEKEVDLIVTHHPLIFRPVKRLDFSQPAALLLRKLIKNEITVYSLHTNLDAAPYGLNQYLAEKLGLNRIKPWGTNRFEILYKLVVYVPRDHVENVRKAICTSGAGHTGNYSDCSFRVAGTGTFKPLPGAKPYLGEVGKVSEVDEYRLETVVPENRIYRVLDALHRAHPYEEIAYDLIRLSNRGTKLSPGRQGELARPVSLGQFAVEVKNRLRLPQVAVVGRIDSQVKKVALVSGSGASFLGQAASQGFDVLLTGDIKYHDAREAQLLGINLVDAGDYGTECLAVELLARFLTEKSEERGWDIEVIPFEGSSPFIFV